MAGLPPEKAAEAGRFQRAASADGDRVAAEQREQLWMVELQRGQTWVGLQPEWKGSNLILQFFNGCFDLRQPIRWALQFEPKFTEQCRGSVKFAFVTSTVAHLSADRNSSKTSAEYQTRNLEHFIAQQQFHFRTFAYSLL
jgi:hypothetical protein